MVYSTTGQSASQDIGGATHGPGGRFMKKLLVATAIGWIILLIYPKPQPDELTFFDSTVYIVALALGNL
jgi:hypothetical protein